MSHKHFCLRFPRNKLWLGLFSGFTSVPAPPIWWEQDRDWSDIMWEVSLSFISSVAVCVCERARVLVYVYCTRAHCIPPTHTNKIKSRSRAPSFQSLPSFQPARFVISVAELVRGAQSADGREHDGCWGGPRAPPGETREEAGGDRRPAEPAGGRVPAAHALRVLRSEE